MYVCVCVFNWIFNLEWENIASHFGNRRLLEAHEKAHEMTRLPGEDF